MKGEKVLLSLLMTSQCPLMVNQIFLEACGDVAFGDFNVGIEKLLPGSRSRVLCGVERVERTPLATSGPLALTAQESKQLRARTHNKPVEGPQVDEEKAPSWAKALARRVKKTFCLTVDVHHQQYNEYYDRKKAYKLNKAIARRQGVPVSPAGSEETIKTEGQWRSAFADDMSENEELDGTHSPPYVPYHAASSSGAGPSADHPGWEDATWDV